MKIIVGICNPGREYQHTRHNIGFQTVEQFAAEHKLRFALKTRFSAELAVGKVKGQEVVLVKPQTFMNRSGAAVQKILDWYKASALDMLLVYDDLDVAFGEIRSRERGRSGGHNGVQSIIDQLNAEEFYRLKIGIGRPPANFDAADYVLANFSKEEKVLVPELITNAIVRIEDFLKKG